MVERKQRLKRAALYANFGYAIGTIGIIISIVTLSIYFTTKSKISTTTATIITSTSTSTSTTTTTAISGAHIVIGYLQSGNYYKKTITSYSNTQLIFPIEIKFVETPTIFLFVLDNNNIIAYDEKGRYIKHILESQSSSFYPIPSGKLFVARFNSNYTIFDMSLKQIYEAPIDQTYALIPVKLRYDYTSGYLYECDASSNYVNALDTSFNRIASDSFNCSWGSNYQPTTLGFYQSAIGNLIYVGISKQNKILVVDQATQQLVSEVTNVCKSGGKGFFDMLVDSSGYIFIPCSSEKQISIFFTNGTYHYDTGLFLPISQAPYSITIDSLGRLAVSMFRQIDIYTPSGYTY